MANIQSAKKRARQAVKRRAQNMALRSRFRTYVKRVLKAIESGDRKAAEQSYREAVPVIDSMVNKHIVHRNKAARQKSRLSDRIKAMRS